MAQPNFSEPVLRRKAGDWLVRFVIPLFVTGGALAKLFYGSPAELPPFVLYYTAKRFLQLGEVRAFLLIVAVELVLAGIMFWHRRWAVWVARATLLLFMAVLVLHQLDMASQNIKGVSCGCFGAVHIPVGAMLATETVLLALTFLLPRRPQPPADIPNHIWIGLTLTSALCIAFSFSSYRLNLIGSLRSPEDLVEIDLLRNAQGERWEQTLLSKFVPAKPSDYAEPVQFWVLYRRTCPLCHEVFREQFATAQPDIKVIAIEIPPWPELPPGTTASDVECDKCERLSLPRGRDWRIRTPLVLRVQDGVITTVERRRE